MRWLLTLPLLIVGLAIPLFAEDEGPKKDAPSAQDNSPPDDLDEVEPGNLRLTLETGGHTLRIVKLFFTPDSKQLVSVGRDNTIRFWDVESGAPLRVLRTPFSANWQGRNQSVALAPDGALVLSGARTKGRPHPYIFFDVYKESFEKVLKLVDSQGGAGNICVAVSPDGKLLATGNWNGVQVVSTVDGKKTRDEKMKVKVKEKGKGKEREKEKEKVGENEPAGGVTTGLAFTSDSRQLAALVGKHIHVVHLPPVKARPTTPIQDATSEFHSILWSADDRKLLLGTAKGIEIWDPAARKKVTSFDVGKTNAMLWDAERKTLLTAGIRKDGAHARISILDPDSGEQRQFHAPIPQAIEAFEVAISPDGKFVAAVAPEELIHVWRRDAGEKPLHTLGNREGGSPVHAAAWSKDGKKIAFGRTLKPDADSLDERQPLNRVFDLTELRLDKKPDPKDYHRAVLERDGVRLHIQDPPRVSRRGQTIDLAMPHCTAGTLLPGDQAAMCIPTGVIRLMNTQTGKFLGRLGHHDAPVLDMCPSPDNRYLLTASQDHTLKIWKLGQPGRDNLLLTIFVARGEWVVWTPEGYYAATPGGEEMMGGTIHNNAGELQTFFTAERFRKQLYRPDVIQRVLEKGSVAEALKAANDARRVLNIAIPRGEAQPDKLLPPSVVLEIVDQTKLPKIRVKVSAEQGCPEQPIKALRLLVDGRPLPSRETTVNFDSGQEVARHAATWEAELPRGRHTLSVMAHSKDDTPNFSNQIVVSSPLPEKERPVVHLVAVGVSQYERKQWNLKYAHSDAQQLSDAIVAATRDGKLYREALVKKLVNGDATREGVKAAIDEVRKAAKANDLFVFSFAGHGIREEGEFYLLTHEADPSDAKTLEKTALSGKMLREKLADFPCQVLLLLDACHSGALASYRPGSDDAARALADVDVRVAVMCAALGHEEALERNDGGLFTSAIVRALKHDPEVFYDKETGELNVYHLQAFVYQQVAKFSDAQQTPYLKMPLAQPAFVVTQFAK